VSHIQPTCGTSNSLSTMGPWLTSVLRRLAQLQPLAVPGGAPNATAAAAAAAGDGRNTNARHLHRTAAGHCCCCSRHACILRLL
jgi:hypothetical protein